MKEISRCLIVVLVLSTFVGLTACERTLSGTRGARQDLCRLFAPYCNFKDRLTRIKCASSSVNYRPIWGQWFSAKMGHSGEWRWWNSGQRFDRRWLARSVRLDRCLLFKYWSLCPEAGACDHNHVSLVRQPIQSG
jgi:hypothetical protein